MPQSHHGTPVVPEQGTPAVPEWGMPLWHCSLQQQVPGQDGMLPLVWGFTMKGPTIPPAETSPAWLQGCRGDYSGLFLAP